MAAQRRVCVIGTGGSIASVGRDSLDLFDYGSAGNRLDIGPLLARVGELGSVAAIETIPFRRVSSEAIGPDDWLELGARIRMLLTQPTPPDGIVIVHGTATVEETAYFLSLTVPRAVPVVLVAAQRPINGLSSDGPLNLVNAVRVAASPASRHAGTLVVMNGEIHAARDVTKIWTQKVDTFASPEFGPLGYADPDGEVIFRRRPMDGDASGVLFDVEGLARLPRVDVVYSYAGADRIAVDACVKAGAAAIVAAAFAPGLPAEGHKEALIEASRNGLPVIIASHGGAGRVMESRWMRANDFIAADSLAPKKARILTMLALAKGYDRTALRDAFAKS